MATEKVGVLVDMSVRGQSAVQGASASLKDLEGTTGGARRGFGELAVGIGAFVGVATGAAFAAKKLYDGLRAGAALITTQERFDKLTNSIDTTADAMLGELRTATRGMIDDMSLMASASQIISLKLADNSDQVVRLATVAGTLNWDMQQVILTFANMSTMRLDALGLSVEEVKNKAAELEAAGMSAQEAFKEAVILAGEARLEVGGVSEAEASFKQFEASITNVKSELLLTAAELARTTGLIDGLGAAANRMEMARKIRELNEELIASGQMTPFQNIIEQGEFAGMATEEMAALIELKMKQIDNALLYNEGAWQGWAIATDYALNGIEEASGETAAAIVRGLAQADAAMMNSAANFMRMNEWTQATTNRYAVWIDSINKRNRAAEEERAELLESEKSMYSYGASLGGVISAEQALAEAHQRMSSAFSKEISSDLSEGLIDEAGLVNMENANDLLFEQARAAGATASQLAMLGIATGQFTQEQAAAALKAAILSEKIQMIAEAVASGQLGYGEAAGSLASFGEQLNAGAIADVQAGIDGAAQAADDFAAGSYEASISVQSAAAMTAIADAQYALDNLSGTYTVNIVANGPYATGPQIVANATNSGGATVAGDNRSGGTHYNVTVTNIVDGKSTGRSALDDVTTDSIKRAMSELGMGKR